MLRTIKSPRSRFALLVHVAVVTVLVSGTALLNPSHIHGEQDYCGPVPINTSSPPPVGFVSVVAPAGCRQGALVTDSTMADGSFVKVNTTAVRFDASAQITGQCQYWAMTSGQDP